MYCCGINGPAISDYNKRVIPLSVIQLGGGHCTKYFMHSIIWQSLPQNCLLYFCQVKKNAADGQHSTHPSFTYRLFDILFNSKFEKDFFPWIIIKNIHKYRLLIIFPLSKSTLLSFLRNKFLMTKKFPEKKCAKN